ncbi:MAG: MtnX-like HAD-IB family phosphatase [Candidatus Omnitrophica bacterium]|nr:MtnX-like HAD-IB family phosphatase [Candidatus Omnitrophota bacterium]
MKIINPEKCIVFFDFDNTIATCDVFDNMLPRFSQDDLWVKLEKDWQKGRIGSHACLAGQINGISISKQALDKYLSGIKLDPYFKKIVKLLAVHKITVAVLSDNFDYILKRILGFNSIKNLKVYSNKLKFVKDKLIPFFPFRSKKCQVCAHCKTKNLLANVSQDSIIIYVGDGRSDICPSQYADLVFAKDALLKYFQDKKLTCFAYKSLKDVYTYLKGVLYEQ